CARAPYGNYEVWFAYW
nr:immunoglobulin heavy chain junction region [Mus musculus]